MRTTQAPRTLVVGGGLVGLSTAFRLAGRGLPVVLVDTARAGVASEAAAGMLAPSTERPATPTAESAHRFALRSRDRYPALIEELREATGTEVPCELRGILEVAMDAAGVERLLALRGEGSEWLEPGQVRALEPALARVAGALFHPGDGVVDNPALVATLREALARMPLVTFVRGAALRIEPPAGDLPARVHVEGGVTVEGDFLVLAAGAWVSGIEGVPLPLPVEPVRGQLLAWRGRQLGHVVYGAGGYVVPRTGETLGGSTMEHVGYDATTSDEGLAHVRAVATRLLPALEGVAPERAWAGLRPVTPDLLPLLGPDPRHPRLLYACGHSRNGVLLAPLTAECLAALVAGEAPPADLAPFAPGRFGG